MYLATLVPTRQQTHTHSDAALALHGVKPHWLAVAWHRVRALACVPSRGPLRKHTRSARLRVSARAAAPFGRASGGS
ncbi:hypothetical protein B0G80_5669 [Paraburkholderia sp. BL6669N2]|nr:hypothetical protein B0G80_5669 [Paraburkholderia sp. BL6669N2]